MLTKRQNFLETIRGGNPDRFVNQFEALGTIRARNPVSAAFPMATPGGPMVKDGWGVTRHWPEGLPGQFPVHDEEHIVLKDITKWKEIVKHPPLEYPAEDWADAVKASEEVDRNEYFATLTMAPGIFEQIHYLMGMTGALTAFYTEPEAMKELIAYITDWELAYGAELLKYYKPDVMMHHDDWGSQKSTFISPEMFEEFFLEPYKKVYGFHKANGVELIIHHADSYAATLVPFMIEMGIDVWQGCLQSNNVPELVKKYGGQISFMGDINNGVVDVPGWTPELVRAEVERACKTNGKLYYIPCMTAGGPGGSFGVYDLVSEEIDRMSKEMF